MNYLKSLKWEMVIYALLCILMGILMMIYPSSILNTICYIIAVIFLLLAIRYLLEYRKRDLINDFYKYELVVGIIFIVAAIFVLVKKDFVISIIPFIVGIIIVISGIMKIENAFDGKIQQNHGIFLSSKRNQNGIGIQSVRHIVEKTGGGCDFTYDNGIFTAKIMLRPCINS